MVDARTPQIKHLSVRCKYEVALPTAADDSVVQPQLLVAVRNVRASRQWWTTGLLNVDTRPRTSSLRSRGCREIHAHSPRDDPALVYGYTRRSVLHSRSRSTSASVVVPRRGGCRSRAHRWHSAGCPRRAVRLGPARLATTPGARAAPLPIGQRGTQDACVGAVELAIMGNRIGGLTCLDDRETSPPRAFSSTIGPSWAEC